MSLAACAALVERGDPDRFATARGPAAARLMPLYAFNLEIARAPWVTSDPTIAEIRLAWWREALDEIGAGEAPRAHEVAAPLAEVIRAARLPLDPFHEMIEARHWDIGREGFADAPALWAHLRATSGMLMAQAARALGGDAAAAEVAGAFGTAAAMAAWLRAVPKLTALGRAPLPEMADVTELAREGLRRLAKARARRAAVPGALLPALLPGWEAGAVLRLAARDPGRVAADRLQRSEFARRAGLAVRALSGRW